MTCLCLTRNRRQWLPKAIACIQRQTYRDSELLILADGEDVRDLVPDDPRIRLIHISESLEIGSKRNLGCDLARGDVIAHWDDDDHSEPERLADQINRLAASSKPVTGYHSMRFTDGASWWQYRGAPDYSLGTALCYRRGWWSEHRFPAVQIAEDGAFAQAAAESDALTSVDAGRLMYATIHDGNTSPRRMLGDNWTRL